MGEGNQGLISFGSWQLDLDAQRLRREGDEYPLDPKDFGVLTHLLEAAPSIVSIEELLDRSWPGAVVGDNALQQVIARLRKTLGDDAKNPSYIETVPRRGYRLLVQAQPVPDSGSTRSNPSLLAWSAVALFACVLVIAWAFSLLPSPGNTIKPVVAVLNFDAANLDDRDALLVSAFTSEVTDHLGSLSGVRVVSPFVLRQVLQGDGGDLERLIDLGANRVVTGEATLIDDTYILQVVATDLLRNEQIKSLRYQVTEDELIGLQGEVALAVAEVFNVEWSEEEERTVATPATENLEALSLKTQAAMLVGDIDTTDVAIRLLTMAVQEDPEYTDAVGALSWAYKWKAQLGDVSSRELAREYAERAMAQDSNNGWARFSIGHVYVAKSELGEAIRHFRVGVRALPTMTSQVDDLSLFLMAKGELVESLFWGIEAYRLWTTNPNSSFHLSLPLLALDERERARALLSHAQNNLAEAGRVDRMLAYTYLLEGDVGSARRSFRVSKPLPYHPEHHISLAQLSFAEGDYIQAVKLIEPTARTAPDYQSFLMSGTPRLYLAFGLLKSGQDFERAQALIKEVKEIYASKVLAGGDSPDPYLELAAAHAVAGEKDEAIKNLRDAVRLGFSLGEFLRIDPLFESLREDPRFIEIYNELKENREHRRARAGSEGLLAEVDIELEKIGAKKRRSGLGSAFSLNRRLEGASIETKTVLRPSNEEAAASSG